MFIYITRHGQPVQPTEADPDPQYPSGDPPLSELGRLQAKKLGLHLRELGFRGRILASPYQRTAETADVIAEVLGTCFMPEPAVRELQGPNIHDFNGLDLQQLKELFPRMHPDSVLEHPWWSCQEEPRDDEGYRPAVTARVGKLLEKLMGADNPDVLLVGHGASAGSAVRYLYQRKTSGEFEREGRTWNCALGAFKFDQAGLVPLYHGDVSHLDDAEVTANSQFINLAQQ